MSLELWKLGSIYLNRMCTHAHTDVMVVIGLLAFRKQLLQLLLSTNGVFVVSLGRSRAWAPNKVCFRGLRIQLLNGYCALPHCPVTRPPQVLWGATISKCNSHIQDDHERILGGCACYRTVKCSLSVFFNSLILHYHAINAVTASSSQLKHTCRPCVMD